MLGLHHPSPFFRRGGKPEWELEARRVESRKLPVYNRGTRRFWVDHNIVLSRLSFDQILESMLLVSSNRRKSDPSRTVDLSSPIHHPLVTMSQLNSTHGFSRLTPDSPFRLHPTHLSGSTTNP